MAVAELIGAAVGVLLLVLVAYLLVGGTLSTAETVATAQKDLTLLQETRLRTDMMIWNVSNPDTSTVYFEVTNTGNEVIYDLPHVDIFSYDGTNPYYIRYRYDGSRSDRPGTWYDIKPYVRDSVHVGELDPGDIMRVKVLSYSDITIISPVSVQMTTSNGVSAINMTPWP